MCHKVPDYYTKVGLGCQCSGGLSFKAGRVLMPPVVARFIEPERKPDKSGSYPGVRINRNIRKSDRSDSGFSDPSDLLGNGLRS